jgi:hypothetical protein
MLKPSFTRSADTPAPAFFSRSSIAFFAEARRRHLRLIFVWIKGEDNASDIVSRPDQWMGTSPSTIDWTTPNAVSRLRATIARLSEEAPFSGCEDNSPEDIVETLITEEATIDTESVSGF